VESIGIGQCQTCGQSVAVYAPRRKAGRHAVRAHTFRHNGPIEGFGRCPGSYGPAVVWIDHDGKRHEAPRE
jgi:hypothetical protein